MSKPMVTQMADLRRLEILIMRMQDAELLLDADGARLLSEIEAVRQSLEKDDTQAAQRHIEQVVRFLEMLVMDNPFAWTDGRAVIQTAYRLLDPSPDSGDPTH